MAKAQQLNLNTQRVSTHFTSNVQYEWRNYPTHDYLKIKILTEFNGNFGTEWDAPNVFGQVYSVQDEMDLPMPGMDTNACSNTACPIQSSTRQTYSYSLAIPKKFPPVSKIKRKISQWLTMMCDDLTLDFITFQGTYTTKWVLRDATKSENTSDQCCFTTKIKLIR